MTWNHRVCKQTHKGTYPTGDEWESVTYGIHEVYYTKSGDIYAITEEPTRVLTEMYEDCKEIDCLSALEETLVWMQSCMSKPVVDMDNIKYAEPD